jgi:hypothetical protein
MDLLETRLVWKVSRINNMDHWDNDWYLLVALETAAVILWPVPLAGFKKHNTMTKCLYLRTEPGSTMSCPPLPTLSFWINHVMLPSTLFNWSLLCIIEIMILKRTVDVAIVIAIDLFVCALL